MQENDLKPEFKLKVAEWEVRKALAGHSNKVRMVMKGQGRMVVSNKVRMVMVGLLMKGMMGVSTVMMVGTNRHKQNGNLKVSPKDQLTPYVC